jgi:CRP-like cAMP-binding protein
MASSPNHLLASLIASDFDLLEPNLTTVSLMVRKDIERPNRRIEAIYFPESGIVSVVAVQKKTEVEVGLIGREGMTGLPIVLGDDRTPHSTYVQVAGAGQCIPSLDLASALGTSRSLRDLLLKYVQAFGVQTTHTAICNARSRLDQRLARWLLMAHDRLDTNLLPLTHEFLSLMLGVRRAGVTEALHMLKTRGLIANGRSQITVRDRKGLERVAGQAYGIPEAEYRRLLGRARIVLSPKISSGR